MIERHNNLIDKDLSPDEAAICTLLGSLKRVEAPGDFDFGVRARIARGVPARRAVFGFPFAVKAAVPLALVLGVGGYIVLNPAISPDVASVQPSAVIQPAQTIAVPDQLAKPLADVAIPSPIVSDALPDTGVPARDTIAAVRDSSRPIDTRVASRYVPPTRRTVSSNQGGGSFDQAGRAPKRILPRGIGIEPSAAGDVSGLRKSLDAIGVKATPGTSGWRVDSVGADKPAAKSGIKPGDVIESIDAASIRLRRNGQTLKINLKP